MGSKNSWADWAHFLVVGIYDIIRPFKFGDNRFRGFWLAEGQILPFPIDFEGRPYNTHTIVWGVIWPFEVFPWRLFQRSVVGRSLILHWSHILLSSHNNNNYSQQLQLTTHSATIDQRTVGSVRGWGITTSSMGHRWLRPKDNNYN